MRLLYLGMIEKMSDNCCVVANEGMFRIIYGLVRHLYGTPY